jgi:prephenate dehydrogenase
MKTRCTIGVVGFGRFGKLMTRYLAADHRVRVYDLFAAGAAVTSIGAEPAGLGRVSQSDVVVLAVPISRMQEVLEQVRGFLRPGSLVVDVCSVKEAPLRWMQTLLPAGVEILGTHPMFGPDSAGDSLQGRKIVLCPVRTDPARLTAVKGYLSSRGLVVIEADPSEHDRQIALSLALTHAIGRALAAIGAGPQEIDTEGYKRLLHILEVVENDTWQLFEDMNRFNPYAQEVRNRFLEALQDIDRRIAPGGALHPIPLRKEGER